MGIVRLFLLYAILIFAKKAPKLITDLLNIKSEGIGLKGLNIKNKMGEAAIVGKPVKNAMTDVHGRMRKGAAGLVAGLIHGEGSWRDKFHRDKEDPTKSGAAFRGLMSGLASGGAEARANGENGLKGIWGKGWNDTRDVAKGGEPTGLNYIQASIKSLNDKMGAQGFASLEAARAKETERFKEALSDKYGKETALKIMAALTAKHGVNGKIRFSQGEEYEKFKDDLKAITEAYDTENVKRIIESEDSLIAGWKAKGIGGVDAVSNEDIGDILSGIDKYGSSILMKKDLLTERGKRLNKMKEAYDRYIQLKQANMDTAEVEAEINALIAKDTEDHLFTGPYMEKFGLKSINITEINDLQTIDKEIEINTKKLKGTENDIAAMKAVEAEKPSDKK